MGKWKDAPDYVQQSDTFHYQPYKQQWEYHIQDQLIYLNKKRMKFVEYLYNGRVCVIDERFDETMRRWRDMSKLRAAFNQFVFEETLERKAAFILRMR